MSTTKPNARTQSAASPAHYRQIYVQVAAGQVFAFIPGTITEIFATIGSSVKKGEPLLSLKAMKMNNNVCAPISGIVSAINVKAGDTVSKNDVLIEIK